MGSDCALNTVGILGGTFDPIHLGHTAMARAVIKEMDIGRVLLIPDGDPPHKKGLTCARHRMEMVRLAAQEEPGLEVSDMEIARAGVTYTVDTLTQLHSRGIDEIVYIVGSDTLMVIESWRTFDKVASLLKALAVVPRPGDDDAAIARQAWYIQNTYNLHVAVLKQAVSPISSTQIRSRAARRQSLENLVCPAVEKYIAENRLYRDDMLDELHRTMTAARYRHTLGVEETALEMARIFGEDEDKARLAALLHDCAKHLDVEEMKKLVREQGIETAPGEEESRALLHAAAGTALAEKRFGVTDEQVLSAIRWHTTGKSGMTRLDQIIYLADMIEPGRRPFPGLGEIRQLARKDLDEAMLLAARRTVEYVKSRGMPLNERTVMLLNSLEENKKRESVQ